MRYVGRYVGILFFSMMGYLNERGDLPARGDLPCRVSVKRGSREATSLSSSEWWWEKKFHQFRWNLENLKFTINKSAEFSSFAETSFLWVFTRLNSLEVFPEILEIRDIYEGRLATECRLARGVPTCPAAKPKQREVAWWPPSASSWWVSEWVKWVKWVSEVMLFWSFKSFHFWIC